MSNSEVFEMVRNGTMTFEEFDDWVSDQKSESYREGSAEAEYQHAMAY